MSGQGTSRRPIYVGTRVCGGCHSGSGMGNQYSLWLHSRHSQAWAVLSRPEAREIVAFSGLRQEPQEAAICLGCHAPAGLAEEWERDETFRLEDGVQCEACHGPGSEYMAEEVMRDREAAMKAGLRIPDARYCKKCHVEKGTHVAVLGSRPLDIEQGLKLIAHPTREHATAGSIPSPPREGAGERSGPKYVGAHACGRCHRGRDQGNQFSVWRKSDHSRAWAVLGTPRGLEAARKQGLAGDPQAEPKCLACHSTGYEEAGGGFAESFAVDDGVGCEACHGPGSDYMPEAVMRDASAAKAAGLKTAGPDTCKRCHRSEKFDFAEAWKKIEHPYKGQQTAEKPVYKTPLYMTFRPGSGEVYVTCEASDSVIVVDSAARKKVAEIPVGRNPNGVAFSPDGSRAFVSNRFDNTVSVIDTRSRTVVRTLAAGVEPHGLLTDRQGKFLYVLNSSSDDISVFDAVSLEWVKNLSASRRPWALAISPDGSSIAVTNSLSRFVPFRETSVSEITLIDTARGIVENRIVVPDANLLLGIAWHPNGEFAFFTENRTKNLLPMTRLLQGWTITSGLGILWRNGRVDQVLLDEPGLHFPDPTDVAFTPDGRYALVTSSGTDRVAVLDVEKLVTMVRQATDDERERVLPNHLGKSSQFIVRHIPTKNSPRGVLVSGDGKTAVVANSLDDTLTLIDLERLEPAGEIDLGGPRTITKIRFGERLFHSANITFRRQFSCHSCHPDGHIDGLTYDIEADGIGISPVDNRTLRGILDTAPFKWEGTNPSLSRQCGPRLAVFFTRIQPFTPEELSALDTYITTILRPKNPYHPVGSRYTPAQRRGKLMFERTMTNDGREVPVELRCVSCHPGPYHTDRSLHDVGTRHPTDRGGLFDTPHLNNIFDSAPYLHNGMASTLEEIWTVHNPDDRHGVTNDMTKDQLNDLIEYLKTL